MISSRLIERYGELKRQEPDCVLLMHGDVLFYLVTSRNRLGEEGPKGFDHLGVERGNPVPCP